MRGRFALALFAGWLIAAAPVQARDYGQQGAVFRVIEPDFLAVIEARLKNLDASGAITALNRDLAARTERKVNRPDPVPGLAPAARLRQWTYDPAITIDHDIRDHKGNVLARQGQRINPLDIIALPQKLVFIDGDVPEQLRWALAAYSAQEAKLVMVRGAPLEAMTRHQRRFYFDQGGALVARFGIRAVPAVAEQRGRVMQLREMPVPVLTAQAASRSPQSARPDGAIR